MTIVWFISYSKCSNWCRISKLLSNFGCLFTFCYSIKTELQTCNLQTGQSISYKYVSKSVLIEFAPFKWQKVNKHPKFDVDIGRKLKHFEYEMNRTYMKLNFYFVYF